MVINKEFFFRNIVYLIMLGIPFSYLVVMNIRILPVLIVFSFLLFLINIKTIVYDSSAVIITFMILLIMCTGLLIGDLKPAFSIVLFFLITYWPLLLDNKFISFRSFDHFIRVYVFLGIVMGLGVIFQSILFLRFGINIGMVGEMKDRVGFGFIWSDYSFFSLYLTSMIPLVWYKRRVLSSVCLSVFLLVASLVTTARTGFFAFFIFLVIYFFFISFRQMLIGKINVNSALLSLFFITISIIFIPRLLATNFSRFLDLDSSGRLEGYIDGLNFFNNNILFGANYNTDLYMSEVGVTPHNLFIYNLVMGGALFFFIFVVWLLVILKKIFSSKNKFIISSLLISLIGFQFIPAIFTAYFFAFILSLMIYSNRLGKLSETRNT